jgi:hypothetical protein
MRVRLSEVARPAVLARSGRSADEVNAQAMPDPGRAQRVMALLDELADLLL